MLNADALNSGTLIGESVSVDAEREGIPLTAAKVSCVLVADGPEQWTFIDFEVAAGRADLAEALSRVLEREGGWYCDCWTDGEVLVVFCDRVLPCRAVTAARSAVEDYARSMRVAESQLHWARIAGT